MWECSYGTTDQVDYKNSSGQQFSDSQLIQLKMPLQMPLQWIVPSNPDSSRLPCSRVSFLNVSTTFTKDYKILISNKHSDHKEKNKMLEVHPRVYELVYELLLKQLRWQH